MMHITRLKKDFIRRRYIAGQLSVSQLAVALGLRRGTIRFYINEFRKIEQQFPEKLADFDFFISKDKVAKETLWHRNLMQVLPRRKKKSSIGQSQWHNLEEIGILK